MIGGSDFNEKKLNDFYFNVKTYYILLKKLKPYTLKITDNITMKKEDDKKRQTENKHTYPTPSGTTRS